LLRRPPVNYHPGPSAAQLVFVAVSRPF